MTTYLGSTKKTPGKCKTGKRPATPVEGTGSGTLKRPSQGARQYGVTDVSGPTYCIAFVEEEESRILVDTGSSVTIISAKFFDKIARKMKKRPIVEEATYKIQGVTGHLEKPRGEVKELPLRFQRNGLVWNLNACITEATAADIILGTNFLIKYGAMLDLPRQQLILTKTKEYQEVIPLVEKKQLRIRMVSVIEHMDIDQLQERDAMEVDCNPNWKCSDGPKEFQCMKRFVPDDVDEDPEPCIRCHN